MSARRPSSLLHHVGQGVANAFAGLVAATAAATWLVVGIWTQFPGWWQATLYSTAAIVTFVMVFVIQHTQNKQLVALQRKLDELIRATQQADNTLISVEEAPENELKDLADTYRVHRHHAAAQ